MSDIIIKWKIVSKDPLQVIYFMNTKLMGMDDEGFSRIIDHIRSDKQAVHVILKGTGINTKGGNSIENTMPFRTRFGELKSVLGGRKIIYESD
jgi:hypothetical protein